MTFKRWDGAAYVDVTTKKRWDGSSWVDLTVAKRWDGATWVDFLGGGGGLSATASTGSVSGFVVNNNLFVVVTSTSVTITPTGGTGPYTYAWALLTGDSAVLSNSPAAATTTFSANVPRWDSREAIMRCTVTDAAMATTTVDVQVLLRHDGTGVPP